jgi:hypothetical protein
VLGEFGRAAICGSGRLQGVGIDSKATAWHVDFGNLLFFLIQHIHLQLFYLEIIGPMCTQIYIIYNVLEP